MIWPPAACYLSDVTCPSCEHASLSGGISGALERSLGSRWWAVEEIPDACAELVVSLRRTGTCERHAAWFASFAALRIRIERARRGVPAGSILVMYGEIDGDGQEIISRDEAAIGGGMIVTRVRRFVSGTALAAVIEVDDRGRRARVTLQIAGTDPLRSMVIEVGRLAQISAVDVVTGLGRAAAG